MAQAVVLLGALVLGEFGSGVLSSRGFQVRRRRVENRG